MTKAIVKHLLCPGEKAAHRTQALCPSRVRMPPKSYHIIPYRIPWDHDGPCAILRCDTESGNLPTQTRHWLKHLTTRNVSVARHIPRCQPARPQSLKSLSANNNNNTCEYLREFSAWGHGLWQSHLLKRWQSQLEAMQFLQSHPELNFETWTTSRGSEGEANPPSMENAAMRSLNRGKFNLQKFSSGSTSRSCSFCCMPDLVCWSFELSRGG